MKLKIPLSARNRFILTAPVVPALFAGYFVDSLPIVAVALALLIVVLIRLVEKKTRLILKNEKKNTDKHFLADSNGDSNNLPSLFD